MFWLVLGIVFSLLVAHFLWTTYTHPVHTLSRQAANMNWVASGVVKDEHGYRNVCFTRDGLKAIVSYKSEEVSLIEPYTPNVFKNFVELERWLTKNEEQPEEDAQSEYHKLIEDHLKFLGHYENVLFLQGTDKEFCTESLKIYPIGYQAGQSPKVIAALLAEAAHKYKANPKLSIHLLKSLQENLANKS